MGFLVSVTPRAVTVYDLIQDLHIRFSSQLRHVNQRIKMDLKNIIQTYILLVVVGVAAKTLARSSSMVVFT